jgi:chromosome segregation ATPase
MIKQIEITNFRNIKHQVLVLNDLTSIITGANNIGKSNTLNAIHWLLTNTLLTDKWGTGENDLNSIVPKDLQKGESTEVTITFDDGASFTKILKTAFNENGKQKGHTTEYKSNGVKETTANWQELLFKELNYTPKLTHSKDVNELRVFTDPLYALQKLDAKDLRALLVDLGCSVSNEEVFETSPRYKVLETYAQTYFNDFTKMRQALKTSTADLTKQLNAIELALNNYKDAEEFDATTRKELEAQVDELVGKLKELKSGNSNLTKDIDIELAEVKADREVNLTKFEADKKARLSVLNDKLDQEEKRSLEAKNIELRKINEVIKIKNDTLTSLETSIKAYSSARENKKLECIKLKEKSQEAYKKITSLEVDLEEIKKREFVGYVTCPDCKKVFVADESALILFNKQKQDDIQRVEDMIATLNIQIKEYDKQFDEDLAFGRKAKAEQEEAENKLEEIKKELTALENEKLAVNSKPVDTSKIEELSSQIEEVEKEQFNTSSYDLKIDTLLSKQKALLLDFETTNASEIASLEEEISQKRELIEAEYMKQSKYNSKLEFKEQYRNTSAKLNDAENLLQTVTSFIQKRISLINEKARTITGIDFVMLEENLSNDGVKEVCYATVDGVEFSNVNTSQKLEVGIKFIHRIKEILGSNNLPILADRLEGFDDIEKIRNLTKEQMICTYVGSKDQKEITII